MKRYDAKRLYDTYFPDTTIREICRKIVWVSDQHRTAWISKTQFLRTDFLNDYYDDELEPLLQEQQLLYLIVEKAKRDGFSIEEWAICEIPYGDEQCQIWCFVNKKEYYQYHTLGKKDIIIHSLDFEVEWGGCAHPSSCEEQKNHGLLQVNKDTCWEAVYVQNEGYMPDED